MKKMKLWKRGFAFVTSLSLLISMSSVAYASEKSNEHNVGVQEWYGDSRLDNITGNEENTRPSYADDEVVTVIVELEEAPALDYFGDSTYAVSGEEKTPGEAVSDFVISEEVKEFSSELYASQEEVIEDISSVVAEEAEAFRAEDVEVVGQWTIATNAVAVRIPYGTLESVKNMEGVKRAYVEHVYNLPEEVENSVVIDGKPTHSYSLDMVEITRAWEAGYTGKGMLIAVLDSGFDIKVDWNGHLVREHEAFTNNSFLSGNPTDGDEDWELRYTNESLAAFLEANQLKSTTGANGNKIEYEDNALYKNLKFPYACDYADGDINVLPGDSDHGTHVAGTIAGYAESAEGEIIFSGVAPDAQILGMKVFSNEGGGATESSIVNALEDSLKLGADIINLSLGSDNGYAFDDTIQNATYARIEDAGIILMTSAGNSGYSSEYNNYGGDTLTKNPDTTMMSAPAIYKSNLAIASIENMVQVQAYMTWIDQDGVQHEVPFADPWSVAMKAGFADQEYPIYDAGLGTYEGYYNANFNTGWNNGKTGFALVKRGEITFTDKINNAMSFRGVNSRGEAYGVLAVIVYDSNAESTELIYMSVDNTYLSSCFISGKDGKAIADALASGYEVKIRVSEVDRVLESEVGGQMSSFTSWGAGPSLELKPEITAPGGNVWSTVIDRKNDTDEGYVGSYDMMSGTSMAAPHMSGIAALIRQMVVTDARFANVNQEDIDNLVNQLLVSTAIPQVDGNRVFYSPRQQGAGLVNAYAALTTPAYITVDGQNVGKIEWKDDPNKKGSYILEFTVHNTSDQVVTYDMSAVLMRPDVYEAETEWGTRVLQAARDVVLKTVDFGAITVEANSSKTINRTISLTQEEKNQLDELFVNGSFVEGFVQLSSDTFPTIGLPFLGFYGDWTKAPIFDDSTWIDEPEDGENFMNNEVSWGSSILGSAIIQGGQVIDYINLGQNVFDTLVDGEFQGEFKAENITLSPNKDGYLDVVDDYILYQLRDARLITVVVKDAQTGEIYMQDGASYVSRTVYNPNYSMVFPYTLYGFLPTWDGTDLEGNVLPTGTKCVYTITAYGDGEYPMIYDEEEGRYVTDFESIVSGEKVPTFNGHEMDMTGDVISFPIVIDTVAPKLRNNVVSFYEENGRTYMTGTVYDEDGSLASVEVIPYVKRTYKQGYGNPEYVDFGQDRNNPFYTSVIYDAAKKELKFTVDVTEYEHVNESYSGENYMYDYTWTGNLILSCGDYGANDRSYAIKVDATEGIVLSQTSALLNPGDQMTLSVNDNTKAGEAIVRTSSNPEVATIDEFGVINAIAPGQTVITVSNGVDFAVCVVAVESEDIAIESFKLSIDKFTGLKPDGQALVKVTDIYPANAKIKDIRWTVSESDEYAENYGEGLITVGQQSEDGLSGYIYLNVAASQYELPSGIGTLTVSLDGVEQTMEISWDDIYTSQAEDDLLSALNYNEQIVYVTLGESADLAAKFRQPSLHGACDIVTDLSGLVLDGPDFYNNGAEYRAKLVNEEGYALPETVRLYTVYSYSDGSTYEYEMMPYQYSYDSITGEIYIQYAPTGATTKLKIVASGVELPGNPAGEVSDTVYVRPEPMFGPFTWDIQEGAGEIEAAILTDGYNSFEGARFTPSEVGVSYITATSKSGYSVNFAIVCEPVYADSLSLETHNVELMVDTSADVLATLNPDPTFEKDAELIWTSFDETVATVDNSGHIVGIKEGYAYIKVSSKVNADLESYVRVHVVKNMTEYDVVFKDYDGTVLKTEKVLHGNSAVAPEGLTREGYEFAGWDKSFDNIKSDLEVTALYDKLPEKTEDDEPSETPEEDDKPSQEPEKDDKPSQEPDKDNSSSEEMEQDSNKPEFQVDVKDDITDVPEGLKDLFETVEELKNHLKDELIANSTGFTSENMMIIDASLLLSLNNGSTWIPGSEKDFPKEGICVTIPYPEGTSYLSHEFVVAHMFSCDMNGYKAGEIEYPKVTLTQDGIQFVVHGFSPIAISWKLAEASNQSNSDTIPKMGDVDSKESWYLLIALSAGFVVLSLRRKNSKY